MVGPAIEIAERVGASCASDNGGSFYVCEGKSVEFIGCCTVDPCKTSNGNCPLESLRNTTYSVTSHDLIPPQYCASSDANDQWWTCGAVKPPFMGCCGVNACQNNGCPADKLTSAILNPDHEKSKIFRSEDSSGGNKLSTGAIAGIAVGAVVGAILILGLLFWLWKRRQAQQNTEQRQIPQGPGNPNEMAFQGHGHPSVTESPHHKLVSPYTSTYTPSVANTQYEYSHHPSSPSPQMSSMQWNENMYGHGQQRGFVPSVVSNGDDGWHKPPQQYMPAPPQQYMVAQELPTEHTVVELPEDTAPAPVAKP